jgi:SAM-dependent methyltransferase
MARFIGAMDDPVRLRGIPGVTSQRDLRHHIETEGCYSREENLRIYDVWFARGPRYLFRAVDAKYGISTMVVCDAGCAFGTNLAYCPPQSYGIELEDYKANFARSIGLTVHSRDLMTDDVTDLPRVGAVWCSAVIEHVYSPHILLRKLHMLLNPGGLLALYAPMLPLLPGLQKVPHVQKYCTAWRVDDHINAFVPSTLRFFCERGGFETIELSPFYPRPLSALGYLPVTRRLTGICIYIGRSIAGWEYPRRATRRAVPVSNGFVFRGEEFPEDRLQ